MGFFKSLFRSRSSRPISVRAMLEPGDTLVAGDVTVETLRLGCLLIRIGSDLTVAAEPTERTDKFNVRCWSTGGRIPQLVNFRSLNSNPDVHRDRQSVPVVRLGPGGDFVQDWPEEKAVSHQPSAVSNS